LVLAAVGVVLAGCTFPSSRCGEEELVAPSNPFPADDQVIDSLTPTLTWTYEGDCEPEAFRISFYTDREFPDGTTVEVEADTTWWVPPTLEPGTGYRWYVQPISGSAEGPWEGGHFSTGPVCGDPSAYAAPALLSPADGESVPLQHITVSDGTRIPTVSFHFVWDDSSSCLPPDGYHLEISPWRDFRPGRDLDEFTTTHQRAMFFFPPGVEWRSCSSYYWRVSTVLPDGSDGPTSETWSFVTPNATGGPCLEVHLPPLEVAPPATGTSAIAGHVFHDECAVPYESTDVAPAGCVIMPDGGMEANGVLDPGEVGIGGVTVHLAASTCPALGALTDVTDVNGYYSFTSLPAGTYCISIDAMHEENVTVLIPGSWTIPYRWYGPGPIYTEVDLGGADIRRLNDFGWDHQFLPAPEPLSTPVPLMGTAVQNANCRAGPSSLYDVLTSVLRGVRMPIVGRNQESTWWAVQAPGLIAHCWLWGQSLEFEGDPSLAPILEAPPLPSPTPAQACWVWNPQTQQNACTSPCPPNAQPGGPCTP
jgi:hypothetical protein